MGALYHTTNFGLPYDQVDFRQLVAGHNYKVCFTSTLGLLYSVSYANDMVLPMKSTDNGLTWTKLSRNPDDSEETFSINADYANPNRVIICYYNEIYFSSTALSLLFQTTVMSEREVRTNAACTTEPLSG